MPGCPVTGNCFDFHALCTRMPGIGGDGRWPGTVRWSVPGQEGDPVSLDDRRVSARMAAAARPVLDAAGISAAIEERSDAAAAQPGAAFALFAEFIGGARLGADRAGAPHRRAESIGARVAHQLLAEIDGGATVDRYASDQILPFASLASGASTFQVLPISEHTETGGWLAALFLGADVRAERNTVVVHGRGTRRLPPRA